MSMFQKMSITEENHMISYGQNNNCNSIVNGNHTSLYSTLSTMRIAEDSLAAAQQKERQSKVQLPSAFKPDSTYVIRAAGFPWIATKPEIVEFFSGIKILNGKNGIHFIIGKAKNIHNDAFIQLSSDKDYQLAMTRKVKYMGTIPVRSNSFVDLVFGIIKKINTKNICPPLQLRRPMWMLSMN